MIDVKAIREAYERVDMNDVKWIKSAHIVAEGLAKIKLCDVVEDLLDTGTLNLSLEQWIVRKLEHELKDREARARDFHL